MVPSYDTFQPTDRKIDPLKKLGTWIVISLELGYVDSFKVAHDPISYEHVRD